MAIRRSILTVPGSEPGKVEKAIESPADEVMVDLEDGVAEDSKTAARETVVETLTEHKAVADRRISVRINALDHQNWYEDVINLVGACGDRIDSVVIPKLATRADVHAVEALLSQVERNADIADSIGLVGLIETTSGLQHVEEITGASRRLEAVVFGVGDYAVSQGTTTSESTTTHFEDRWYHARSRIVVAARANDIDAIDGPYADFSDSEGFQRECERARELGFVGKWAIHPNQIEVANQTFRPTETEIEHAREIVEAMEDGAERGDGAVELDGQMIDDVSIRRARRTLELARRLGLTE